MTRLEFYQQLLLTNPLEGANDKLKAYDKESDEDSEEKDIEEFINHSKNFKKFRIVTPFGICPIAVPREYMHDMFDYLNSKHKGYNMLDEDII